MNNALTTSGGKIVIKNFSQPVLKSQSVIIEHKAFGMNYDDLRVIEGKISNPNPYSIFGVEASGIVVESSSDSIKKFKVGDRVCYATYGAGAFVKYRCVNENYIVPIPKYCTFEEGATLLKGLLAYTLLGKVFVMKPPATLIISGASGAVGSLLTQISAKVGFKTIALTSNDAKKNHILSNGADAVINYKKDDVPSAVKSLTEGKGADFFFDCLGQEVENFAFQSLKTRGFFISYGAITGEGAKLNIANQRAKSITTTKVSVENFIEDYGNFLTTSIAYFKSIQAGVVRPQVNTFAFDNAEQAFRDLKNAVVSGQKVLTL
jgi:NADPH2:quinone reductase